MIKKRVTYGAAMAAVLLLLMSFVQPPKLKKFSITKDISVFLPEDFTVMPDEGIAKKYPSHIKPLGVLTDPSGLVDFSVTEKPATFGADDLPMLQKLYKSAIINKFSEVEFLREEIAKVNKHEHIIFEFVSTVRDDRNKSSTLAPVKKYTHVHYAVRSGKLLIFTLNVPFALKPKWEQQSKEIMSTIRI